MIACMSVRQRSGLDRAVSHLFSQDCITERRVSKDGETSAIAHQSEQKAAVESDISGSLAGRLQRASAIRQSKSGSHQGVAQWLAVGKKDWAIMVNERAGRGLSIVVVFPDAHEQRCSSHGSAEALPLVTLHAASPFCCSGYT